MRLRRVAGWSTLLASVGLATGIWVMLIVLATRPGLKTLFDLSPQARFTVQPETRGLLAGLREQGRKLELHTVFEPLTPPGEGAAERDLHIHRIRDTLQGLTVDLLRQYAYAGGDAVTVRHHDIRRDLEQIRQLMRAVQAGRSNFVLVKLGDRSKVLSVDYDLAEVEVPGSRAGPALPGQRDPLPILRGYKGEEAISSAIKSLLVEGTPTIYVLEGYRTASIRERSALSYSELMHALEQEGFAIQVLNLAESRAIPADAAALALFEPRSEIPEADVELLLGYLRRGGRLFLNVAYVLEPEEWNPTLAALGERLGFALGQDLVCNLIPDPNNPKAPPRHGEHLVQNLTIVDLNPVHPVTKPIYLAGRYPVVKAAREFVRRSPAPEDVAVDPSLLRTSRLAWIEERTVATGTGQRTVDFHAPADPQAFAPRCVGAVIDVVARDGERPGHVVVVTGNAFINAMLSENGDLALNIFQWMAERAALVTVRGERYKPNLLKVAPQQAGRARWLLLLGVPGSMLLAGIVVLWRRGRA